MKTNIDHVNVIYWKDPNNGKTCWKHIVFYKKTPGRAYGIHRIYTWKENLPYTVLNFVVDASVCETTYIEPTKYSHTYKKETYR